MTQPPSPHHFQTTQPRELLGCVEHAAELASKAVEDHGAWRWLVIAITLGVQNAWEVPQFSRVECTESAQSLRLS